jgi:ABC-type uncharacterized transport system auxiliary subunit
MNSRFLLISVVALLLCGCSSLMQRQAPEPDVYALTTASHVTTPAVRDEVLQVARPRARAGLDTEHVVVSLPDGRSDMYAGARWAAPLPQMVDGLLIDALRAHGVARAVVSDRSTFHGQYLLQTEIVAFTAEYSATGVAPTVRVALRGDLGTSADRRVIATVEGSGTAVARADRRSDVVAAYQAAWDTAVTELVTQVDAALGRAQSR